MSINQFPSDLFLSSPTREIKNIKSIVGTDKMYDYILTARKREQVREENLRLLQRRGIEVAKQAATMLRQDFNVTRVVLFGSMLQPRIHKDSDIDIAVWDLAKSDYFQAVGKLQGLSEFAIDLIEAENTSGYIIEAIAQGIEL